MILGGALLYARERSRLWALALAAAAGSRFFMSAAYLGARLLFAVEGRTYAAQPVFDEHAFAKALGLPPLPVTCVAALVLVGMLYWLFHQTKPERRLPFALALIAGIGAASIVWVAITPPVLISYPAR